MFVKFFVGFTKRITFGLALLFGVVATASVPMAVIQTLYVFGAEGDSDDYVTPVIRLFFGDDPSRDYSLADPGYMLIIGFVCSTLAYCFRKLTPK